MNDSHYSSRVRIVPLVAALTLAMVVNAAAQTTEEPTPPVSPTDPAPRTDPASEQAALIEAKRKAAETSTALDEEARKQVLANYDAALASIAATQTYAKQAAEFNAARESAPERMAAIQKELAKPTRDPVIDLPPNAPLDDYERRWSEANAQFETAKTEAAKIENEAATRTRRRQEISTEQTAAAARLDAIESQLVALPANGASPLDASTRQRLITEREMLIARRAAAEAELASYESRGQLLLRRQEFASRTVTERQREADAWRAAVEKRREQMAEREREEAQRRLEAAADDHPFIRKLAEQNQKIVEETAQVLAKTTTSQAKAQETTGLAERLTTELEQVRARLNKQRERGGLTESTGIALRRLKADIPDRRLHVSEIERRNAEIARVDIRLLDMRRQRQDDAPIADAIADALASLDPPSTRSTRAAIEARLKNQITYQREQSAALYKAYDNYFDAMLRSDEQQTALLATIDRVIKFVDENVLWVRSSPPIDGATLADLPEGSAALFDGEGWAAAGNALDRDLRRHPFEAAIAPVLALIAVLLRLRTRRWLAAIERRVDESRDGFAEVLAAIALHTLAALCIPLLIALLAWRLNQDVTHPLPGVLAAGLWGAALALFTVRVLLRLVRAGGIGRTFFRWKRERFAPMAFHLRWLAFALPPLVFVHRAMEATGVEQWSDSLGRVTFLVIVVGVTVVAQRVFRAGGAWARTLAADRPNAWLVRLRWFWYSLFIGLGPLLAVITIAGYYYSAVQVGRRCVVTAWMVITLLVLQEVVQRLLYLERRRLAIEQRRKRRVAAEAAAANADPDAPDPAESGEPQPVELGLDLYTINLQTRKLIGTTLTLLAAVGLYLIWSPVLPALGLLDRITVWEDADAGTMITLANVLLSVIIIALTAVAARNIPGLLEITLLQRLPMRPSTRFAVTTLVRYCLVVVGLVAAFNVVGVSWSKVQWLVAAITVGLGFGLQEIFANFVSGIIILFEQPIRVGDTLTIGGINGTVTRIQIRATTITDWDRKELIVPNKEFVTAQLINWTLSDPSLRVRIPVGIAYGSDTEKARDLLLKTAIDNPNVIDQPAPSVLFRAFGESSLDFELRVFIQSIEHLQQTPSQLHFAIDQAFREAGIEISFPQRDLHIRSIDDRVKWDVQSGEHDDDDDPPTTA